MPYVIGADFGTLSARFLLVNPKNGDEINTVVMTYPNGVMEETLHGKPLPEDYALEDASDYLLVLRQGIQTLVRDAKIDPSEVIAIGVDFTASTILPVDQKLMPLSQQKKYMDNPHAYVKLWKHHAAQAHATRAASIAKDRHEAFIKRYGDQITSEWMIPKIMEILTEDPDLYNDAYRFIEGGDFIVSHLIGEESRSACQAGYKALWHQKEGYPSKAYFKALDPRLEHVIEEKMGSMVKPVGTMAGRLTDQMAKALHLVPGIPVSTAYIDAHSAVPALGITTPGNLVMILGTSTCHMVLDHEEHLVKGISGVVKDGIIPGLYGYEAGQACVGNALEWFVETMLSKTDHDEALSLGITPYELLERKAIIKAPGASGLVALDWLNGNRSILSDSDLSGMILGLSLRTNPEDIYRALIESTAYGARVIIEEFESQGLKIDRLYATGGISKKSPMFMQIYADVTGRPIHIGQSEQAVALGSAIAAAAIAGSKNGGYDTISDASIAMGKLEDKVYVPVPSHIKTYDKLYRIYRNLHDHFGVSHPEWMHTLKNIKTNDMKGQSDE